MASVTDLASHHLVGLPQPSDPSQLSQEVLAQHLWWVVLAVVLVVLVVVLEEPLVGLVVVAQVDQAPVARLVEVQVVVRSVDPVEQSLQRLRQTCAFFC